MISLPALLFYTHDNSLLLSLLASIEQPHNTVHLVVGGSGGDMVSFSKEVIGHKQCIVLFLLHPRWTTIMLVILLLHACSYEDLYSFSRHLAFDPIFFLHHCNVDRILALWEHVYPLYWIGTKGYETPSGSLVPFSMYFVSLILPGVYHNGTLYSSARRHI